MHSRGAARCGPTRHPAAACAGSVPRVYRASLQLHAASPSGISSRRQPRVASPSCRISRSNVPALSTRRRPDHAALFVWLAWRVARTATWEHHVQLLRRLEAQLLVERNTLHGGFEDDGHAVCRRQLLHPSEELRGGTPSAPARICAEKRDIYGMLVMKGERSPRRS